MLQNPDARLLRRAGRNGGSVGQLAAVHGRPGRKVVVSEAKQHEKAESAGAPLTAVEARARSLSHQCHDVEGPDAAGVVVTAPLTPAFGSAETQTDYIAPGGTGSFPRIDVWSSAELSRCPRLEELNRD